MVTWLKLKISKVYDTMDWRVIVFRSLNECFVFCITFKARTGRIERMKRWLEERQMKVYRITHKTCTDLKFF